MKEGKKAGRRYERRRNSRRLGWAADLSSGEEFGEVKWEGICGDVLLDFFCN